MSELTVIIPVFNEADSIGDTLAELLPLAASEGWEVIAVNDGSSDDSGRILDSTDGLRILHHPVNRGYGASLKSGIRAATSETVAFYDADGQHRPEDLKTLRTIYTQDLLVGQRGTDSHQDWIRKPGKWLLGKVANFLTGRKIPDLNSGMRIARRKLLLRHRHLFSDQFSFSTTSTIAMMNLGYDVAYHPIRVRARVGQSTVSQLRHGPETILLIIRLILLFNPLKVFLPVAKWLFLLALTVEIIDGVIRVEDGIKITRAALSIGLTSVLVFFFGLIVDQISELRKQLGLRVEEKD